MNMDRLLGSPKKNKWMGKYKTGYCVRMKFNKKKNSYVFYYGGSWRTPEGIKKHQKSNHECLKNYYNTEKGFITTLYKTMKESCNKNSYKNKIQKRKPKINNGIRDRDHLLDLWEKQKKLLGGPYCAYTGIELTTIREKGFGLGQHRIPTNISLDRIDNSLPYQEDNIVFCSWEFNDRKGRVMIEDCNLILKTWKEKQNEHG